MSWESGSSATKLQAGGPVSFFFDTTDAKPGRYTLRVTISAPGGTARSIGTTLNAVVS